MKIRQTILRRRCQISFKRIGFQDIDLQMKRIFVFLFVLLLILLYVQETALAKELSLYEEFDPQIEFKPEENKDMGDMITEPPADTANKEDTAPAESAEFFLTDEKHDTFLAENEQYALADSMLNQTWKLLMKKLDKKAYRKLWQGHKVWLDTGRNTVANSFKDQVPQIPEYHAFMLATVAKTQELAQSVWHEPVLGRYVKGENFVTLTREEEKTILQGYGNISYLTSSASKESDKKSAQADEQNPKEQAETDKISQNSGETAAKNLQTMPQLLFRAELPENGKLWLALSTVNEQKLYLLTMKDSLCIVHVPNIFPVDFNGAFARK